MTDQEAINVLEKYADIPKSETVRAAYQMAISALEKQIPKKPKSRKAEKLIHWLLFIIARIAM